MQEKIFWHTTVDMPSDKNLTPLPDKVEVAIMGGGYTGLSAARTLAKRGTRVAVLEAETIGWGASSRNGGMTLTGLKLSLGTVIQRYGHTAARTLFQCSLDSIALVEQIIREENIQCDFARTGHLIVANKPQHYRALSTSVDFMQKEFNHPVRLVPREKQREEIGSDLYFGGLVDETSGGLNPAQYVAGLAQAAERAGALLCARARVNRVSRVSSGFKLETTRGEVLAEKILVATSGYTSRATPQFQRRVIPIGSFIIATEPLSEALANEISPRNRMIFDSRHFLNYYRLSADKRMIFGGRAAFFPENENTIRQSAEILRREMIQVYPQLKDAKVEYAWGGTLDFTFDMMTHVGEEDGIYYSLGYAGHGVAMASYLGATVAEAMLAGTIKQHPCAMYQFPNAPFGLYNGAPWFLPLAALWYRILDLVE